MNHESPTGLRFPVGGRRPLIRSPVRGLLLDTEGGALLETAIVLPVLALFIMVIMEISLMANARHLANHAAFSAARIASVYGVDSTQKAQMAAALTMSPISTGTTGNASPILSAFGLPDPNRTVQTLGSIPGFDGNEAVWLERLAVAHLRTGIPACDTGTVTGKTRKHIVVNITYVYRCVILPFGLFWSRPELDDYISYLQTLPDPIPGFAGHLESNRQWNIPIRGRAVTEYWAE